MPPSSVLSVLAGCRVLLLSYRDVSCLNVRMGSKRSITVVVGGVVVGLLAAFSGVDEDLAHSSIRYGIGRFTTEAEVRHSLAARMSPREHARAEHPPSAERRELAVAFVCACETDLRGRDVVRRLTGRSSSHASTCSACGRCRRCGRCIARGLISRASSGRSTSSDTDFGSEGKLQAAAAESMLLGGGMLPSPLGFWSATERGGEAGIIAGKTGYGGSAWSSVV